MIQIEKMNKVFHLKSGDVAALDNVTLNIGDGMIYGVIGYSGAGKSTLVRCLNLLETPDSGTLSVGDSGVITLKDGKAYDAQGRKMTEKKLGAMRRGIGMIFQHFNLLDRSTVFENIAYPLRYTGMKKADIEARVFELLDLVDLRDKADVYPSQLSGGQKQRVGIARALATNPEILLADEATSALDPETTTEVLALLKRVNEEFGITIVLITHQMNVVQQIAGRVAVMSAGRVVESGDVYDVFAAPQQPVTKRFIATALSGLPEEDRVERLHHEWSGRIVTVLIRQKDVSGTQGHELKASGQNISELIAKYGVESSLLYGGIDTVKGTAIGAITYEFNGPGWHVDEFLRELAANSDVIDFGTAAKPVAYADAVAGHASYAEDRAHDPLAADTATAPAASAAAHEGANA